MKLLLEPPRTGCATCEIDCQIQRAIKALYDFRIRIRGIGRFGYDRSAVVLERDTQGSEALNALARVGIGATLIRDKSGISEREHLNMPKPQERSSGWKTCPREHL